MFLGYVYRTSSPLSRGWSNLIGLMDHDGDSRQRSSHVNLRSPFVGLCALPICQCLCCRTPINIRFLHSRFSHHTMSPASYSGFTTSTRPNDPPEDPHPNHAESSSFSDDDNDLVIINPSDISLTSSAGMNERDHTTRLEMTLQIRGLERVRLVYS